MEAGDQIPNDQGLRCEEDKIFPTTFRQLALANVESIGKALVEKASEGHYNSAHLLLEMGGIGTSAIDKRGEGLKNIAPRMFLLDLVDKLLSRNQAREGKDAGSKI